MGKIQVVGPLGSQGKDFPRLQHPMPGPGREAAKMYPATILGWAGGHVIPPRRGKKG